MNIGFDLIIFYIIYHLPKLYHVPWFSCLCACPQAWPILCVPSHFGSYIGSSVLLSELCFLIRKLQRLLAASRTGAPALPLPEVDYSQSLLTPCFSKQLHQVLLLEPTPAYPCHGSRQSPDGAFPDSPPTACRDSKIDMCFKGI